MIFDNLPLKEGIALYCNKFEFPLRMLCAKSRKTRPSVSGEKFENIKRFRKFKNRQTD